MWPGNQNRLLTKDEPASPNRQGLSADAMQNLALGMDWDLRAQGVAAANFKADLGLERNDAGAASDALGAAANLSVAMKF